MRVCHYAGLKSYIEGGIDISIEQQRTALQKAGVEYTTDPDDDYDVLHLNLITPTSIWQAKRARNKGKPVLVHTHTTAEDFRDSFRLSNLTAPLLKRYVSYVYNHADGLICPTEYNEDIINSYGFDNTTVISNGIDTSRFDGYEDLRDQAREKYDLSGDVVFCVGSVLMRKAPDDFIETARRMPETDFIWFGTIMSGLVLQGGTRDIIEEAPDNVTFTGYIDDIREAFAAGDIYFYPTTVENQGIPSLEASYCHRPAVLRNIPVFEEYFTHEHNCLKADDIEGFVTQIERLKDDETLRENLTEQARQTAQDHTLEAVGNRLREVYKSALEGQG